MGVYLNQLPPTEVARLKAELAETLIANFCYPRFYDYRVSSLRTRPVDRARRQEVWQYLNAVDFHVWGRVDIDSPEFQHQVERLFIHFVQRNRTFFGEQGRKRMADVRSLITHASLALAEGVRKHLQSKQGNPALGSPRPVTSWRAAPVSKHPELTWEQILSSTMQLQQQLQEVRGEVHLAAPIGQTPSSATHMATPAGQPSVASRRSRSVRSAAHELAASAEGRERETLAWPPTDSKVSQAGEKRLSVSFPAGIKEAVSTHPASAPGAPIPDTAATMSLPVGKPESAPPAFQPGRVYSEVSTRPQRPKMEAAPATPFVPAPPSGPLRQPLSPSTGSPSAPNLPAVAAHPGAEMAVKQPEQTTVVMNDEDVVIFEQLRYQLIIELRVEVVREGIDLNGQGAFQLVEALRHQDGTDLARLQVVSTLLNMCDQIISSGRASLSDYKQAMMFYLMHTRRTH